MKVLNVIPYWGVKYGGPFINAVNLSNYFTQAGNEAVLLSTIRNNEKNAENKLIAGINYPSFLSDCIRNEDFICFSPGFAAKFRRISVDYDVVLIHGFWRFPMTYAARYCRKKNIPYYIFTHGQLSRWSLSVSRVRKAIYYFLFLRRDLSAAKAVFFMRQDELRFLKEFKVNKILFRNALDTSAITAPKEEALLGEERKVKDMAKLLYLSRIHPKKGLLLVVRSLSEIVKKYPYVKLTVAGPVEDRRYFEKVLSFIRSKGLENNIIFKGLVDGEEKQRILNESGIFLLPTKDDCAPLAILEALAAGLPVITTKGADIPEIDRQMGFIVKEDPLDISNAVIRIISDGNLALHMSKRGQEYVLNEFTWSKRAKELELELKQYL